MKTADKQIVKYSQLRFCRVGCSANVTPMNHTNPIFGQDVENGFPCTTSDVISFNEDTGVFETMNTIYVPGQ